jgi:hypothetical protein
MRQYPPLPAVEALSAPIINSCPLDGTESPDLLSYAVVDDGQIFWAARFLVDRWGDHASTYAGRKANELFALGSYEGCAIWRRIRAAVEDLHRDSGEKTTIH